MRTYTMRYVTSVRYDLEFLLGYDATIDVIVVDNDLVLIAA